MQRIAWVKKRHRISLFPRRGEILLVNHTFTAADCEAYICKECRKVVLDYTGMDFQEG